MRAYHIIFLAIILMAGCGKDKPEVPPPAAQNRPPSQTIGSFRLVETVMGKKSWVLVSDEAKNYQDRQQLELSRLTIDFYRKEGDSVSATLTAGSGKVNTATRDMEARNNVVVAAKDGLVLTTDSLKWNNLQRRLLTESHVRLERGSDWLTGEGMEASPDLSEVVLKRNVRGKKELLDLRHLK